MGLELQDRYYDPYSQKFLSEDPIGFASGDVNHFRYVSNQPLLYKDPSGTIGGRAILLFCAAAYIGTRLIEDGKKLFTPQAPKPPVEIPSQPVCEEIIMENDYCYNLNGNMVACPEEGSSCPATKKR